MKNLYITFIAFLTFSFVSLGNPYNSVQEKPQVGDTLIVSKSLGENYKHINFPRLNMIVKRGGIASYKSVHNTKVVVEEVIENEYGRLFVKLKRADGKKFFNQDKYVTANYDMAISSGELLLKS